MSYLYFIIPPVVIVVSFAVLLFWLSKKVPDIDKIKESKEKEEEESSQLKLQRFKVNFFGMLEKIAQWFKSASVRSHNLLEVWLRKIKEKKRKFPSPPKIGKKIDVDIIESDENTGDNEEFKFADVDVDEKEAENKGSDKSKNAEKGIDIQKQEKESFKEKAMISDEVVYPEIENQEKSQLEEHLIERIATDPRDLEAYERLGDYYMEQDNIEDALACYKQVLKLSPANRKAKISLRRIERVLGRRK